MHTSSEKEGMEVKESKITAVFYMDFGTIDLECIIIGVKKSS
jgi:hypothetical protein